MENGVMIARFWEKPKQVWIKELDGKVLMEMHNGDGELEECVKFGNRAELQGF